MEVFNQQLDNLLKHLDCRIDFYYSALYYISLLKDKVSSSYHFCVEYFSQLSFDSEMYTKSATAAEIVYISESNESWEKYSTQRW